MPADIEELLLVPRPSAPPNSAALLRYYLSVAPELAGRARGDQEAPRADAGLSDDIGDGGAAGRTIRGRRIRHHRGEFLQPEERVEPEVLSALPPLPAGSAAQPSRFRPLAGRSAQSAGRPSDDESSVGRLLRPRLGADHGGFRLHRRAADASRIARLAGGGVRSPRLVAQDDASADRHQRGLSAIVARDAGIAGPRSGQQAAGARAALCGWRRNCCAIRPWERAVCCRTRSAGRASFRRSRQPSRPRAPTGRWDGKPSEGRIATAAGCIPSASARRRSRVHDLRCAQRRGVRRPARGVEHAAASADVAQRCRVSGVCPGARAAGRRA